MRGGGVGREVGPLVKALAFGLNKQTRKETTKDANKDLLFISLSFSC